MSFEKSLSNLKYINNVIASNRRHIYEIITIHRIERTFHLSNFIAIIEHFSTLIIILYHIEAVQWLINSNLTDKQTTTDVNTSYTFPIEHMDMN
jgi:hypothetical protein